MKRKWHYKPLAQSMNCTVPAFMILREESIGGTWRTIANVKYLSSNFKI